MACLRQTLDGRSGRPLTHSLPTPANAIPRSSIKPKRGRDCARNGGRSCERFDISGFRLRASKGFSIPSYRFGQRGITPAFGYGAPHPSAGGTLTLLIHALLSAHYEPLRHPMASGLSLAGIRLVIPDHALGLPVLRTLSLCTCCRHYPGAAPGRTRRSSHPAVSAFPERVVGSACTSSFSRLARRSLALRPAHLRGHQFVTRYTEGFSHFVTSMTAPVASGWSGCRVGLAPTGKRRLSRRTPISDFRFRPGLSTVSPERD